VEIPLASFLVIVESNPDDFVPLIVRLGAGQLLLQARGYVRRKSRHVRPEALQVGLLAVQLKVENGEYNKNVIQPHKMEKQ